MAYLDNINKIIADCCKDLLKYFYSAGSLGCSKCGDCYPQVAFPIYCASGGLSSRYIVYIFETLPESRVRVLPVEISDIKKLYKDPKSFSEFMSKRTRELQGRGKVGVFDIDDLGRAESQDIF